MYKKYTMAILVLLIIVFVLAGFKVKKSTAENTSEYLPIKVTIEVQSDGNLLHYTRISIYDKSDFTRISASIDEFSKSIENNFKSDLKKYNKKALNCLYSSDISTHSIKLACDIQGSMYSTNSYDFHWLLAALPFDLYKFKQEEKELVYDGDVNSIPTTIRLKFSFPITHCHEHVWPVY